MPELQLFNVLLISSAVFGTFIGAYYGTIEYRIRENLPLATSQCFCPSCGRVLPLHHQIPIVGFLLLKGRCRFCRTPIPVRYALIEGGFLIYYSASFLIFFRTPAVYLILWYAFICVLMAARCQKQYRSLLKGLGIMSGYHAVISALYLALYSACQI